MQQASISRSSLPQLKGARLFSFKELKECTNSFSEANDIGSGGYGKVSLLFLNQDSAISHVPTTKLLQAYKCGKLFTGVSGSTSNRRNGCYKTS